MRVLLRNHDNSSLRCMKITNAYYNPGDEELVVENEDDMVTFTGVSLINANHLISKLYSEGSVDLTLYHNDL